MHTKSPTIFLMAIIIIVLSTISCNKVSRKNIDKVVQRDLITFNKDEIPNDLKHALLNTKNIFFGRNPSTQEHQDYLLQIINLFKDSSIILFHESSQAYSWIVEDYMNNDRDALPEFINETDRLFFENIHQFISSQGMVSKFHCNTFGINHSPENFLKSIEEVEKITGPLALLDSVKMFTPDTKPYIRCIYNLSSSIRHRQLVVNDFVSQYGTEWFRIVSDLTEAEKTSLVYRTNRDRYLWFMESDSEIIRMNYTAEKFPDAKKIFNCSYLKAKQGLGYYNDIPHNSYPFAVSHSGFYNKKEAFITILTVGIKGEQLNEDGNLIPFDIPKEVEKDDLIRIIANHDNAQMSLLELDDEIFESEMNVTYITGQTENLIPAWNYNFILSYPTVSVSLGSK